MWRKQSQTIDLWWLWSGDAHLLSLRTGLYAIFFGRDLDVMHSKCAPRKAVRFGRECDHRWVEHNRSPLDSSNMRCGCTKYSNGTTNARPNKSSFVRFARTNKGLKTYIQFQSSELSRMVIPHSMSEPNEAHGYTHVTHQSAYMATWKQNRQQFQALLHTQES